MICYRNYTGHRRRDFVGRSGNTTQHRLVGNPTTCVACTSDDGLRQDRKQRRGLRRTLSITSVCSPLMLPIHPSSSPSSSGSSNCFHCVQNSRTNRICVYILNRYSSVHLSIRRIVNASNSDGLLFFVYFVKNLVSTLQNLSVQLHNFTVQN